MSPKSHGQHPVAARESEPVLLLASYLRDVRKGTQTCTVRFCPNTLDKRQQYAHVDIRRCRKSCLVEATGFLWPVFCCHDEITTRTEPELGDFNWIDLPAPKTRSAILKALPFDGPRFYSREATQFLLRYGICTYDNIPIHIPAQHLFQQTSS